MAGLPEDLWGPEPTPAQMARVEAALDVADRERRAAVAAQSVTLSEAADRVGWSRRQLQAALDAGDLLFLPDRTGPLVPTWQLVEGSPGRVLPGIARLARTFTRNVVPLTLWMLRPSPDLGRRTPRQALADGDVDKVVDLARTLTAAGW